MLKEKTEKQNHHYIFVFCMTLLKVSLYGSCLAWHVSCAPIISIAVHNHLIMWNMIFVVTIKKLKKEFATSEWNVLIDEEQTNLEFFSLLVQLNLLWYANLIMQFGCRSELVTWNYQTTNVVNPNPVVRPGYLTAPTRSTVWIFAHIKRSVQRLSYTLFHLTFCFFFQMFSSINLWIRE